MQPTLPLAVLAAASLALVYASVMTWARIAARVQGGNELLPYEPRDPVPWTGWHLLLLLAAYICFGLVSVGAAKSPGESKPAGHMVTEAEEDSAALLDIAEIRALLRANAALSAALVLVVVVVLHWGRASASWSDLGLSLTRLAYDLRLGLLGFVAASVPVYALHALLGPVMPGEHPLLKFMRDSHEPADLALAAVSAVVIAPLSEELLFRVLIQGWLESHWRIAPAPPQAGAGPTPVVWPPIVASSAVFALLHLGHGPAPIPLFGLALVLGYLFQRTHRIWPSVTLHCLLNSCSFAAFWLQLAARAGG